jgi:hypothetical protein
MHSYSNCLLASLNFRLVLRNPQNLNLTEIVENDLAVNTTSRRWDTQSAHITYARAESVMDITADLNEVRRMSTPAGSLFTQVIRRIRWEGAVLSKTRYARFVISGSQLKPTKRLRRYTNCVICLRGCKLWKPCDRELEMPIYLKW